MIFHVFQNLKNCRSFANVAIVNSNLVCNISYIEVCIVEKFIQYWVNCDTLTKEFYLNQLVGTWTVAPNQAAVYANIC